MAAEISLALDVDQPALAECGRRCDAHGLAKRVPADFDDAEPVHLADSRAFAVDQQRAIRDHLADFRFDEVVPLDFGLPRGAEMSCGYRRFRSLPRDVAGFAREIGEIDE